MIGTGHHERTEPHFITPSTPQGSAGDKSDLAWKKAAGQCLQGNDIEIDDLPTPHFRKLGYPESGQ